MGSGTNKRKVGREIIFGGEKLAKSEAAERKMGQ